MTSENLLTVAEKRAKSGWMFSTVALRLKDGTSVVYNPTKNLPASAHEAILGVGRPSVLLAPNHYHNLGLPEFAERYPGVRCVCSETARPRLVRQTGLTFEGLPTLATQLPDAAAILAPPGTRNGEVFLTVEGDAGPVWIVCDAFFNVPKHPTGSIGFFTQLFGVTAGLRIGQPFKWIGLRDRAAYAQWILARLHETPPAVLIPSHGVPMQGPDLGARLIALVERRLM